MHIETYQLDFYESPRLKKENGFIVAAGLRAIQDEEKARWTFKIVEADGTVVFNPCRRFLTPEMAERTARRYIARLEKTKHYGRAYNSSLNRDIHESLEFPAGNAIQRINLKAAAPTRQPHIFKGV